ncbi:YitT family protein [Virgibacillus soli]|uniref:YczE/YyaS/YitT family protein n=1 Tax=Paracerasibacillus soli TaxID=480284 RepID=UPI0035E85B85
MIKVIRWSTFLVGLIFFSLGIALTINVQHLGVHPWDVLTVALYEKVGFSIGTWNILIGLALVVLTWIFDKQYVKIGTFLNALIVGSFVDFFLWIEILPTASHTWTDIFIIISGIILMGLSGGLYNAARIGSGPRDGFMLSLSEKLALPIRRVRIITECLVLVVGFLLGGPIFWFTFIFTFIQSPLFQFAFVKADQLLQQLDNKGRHVSS